MFHQFHWWVFPSFLVKSNLFYHKKTLPMFHGETTSFDAQAKARSQSKAFNASSSRPRPPWQGAAKRATVGGGCCPPFCPRKKLGEPVGATNWLLESSCFLMFKCCSLVCCWLTCLLCSIMFNSMIPTKYRSSHGLCKSLSGMYVQEENQVCGDGDDDDDDDDDVPRCSYHYGVIMMA